MELCEICKDRDLSEYACPAFIKDGDKVCSYCCNCGECPDYYAEVIETLRQLYEGIMSLDPDDERLKHLADAELWIRMHALDPHHPYAIN